MSIDHFFFQLRSVHTFHVEHDTLYYRCKGTKWSKMQYLKLSYGSGSCLFSATCWGWVTKFCGTKRQWVMFLLKNRGFISSGLLALVA